MNVTDEGRYTTSDDLTGGEASKQVPGTFRRVWLARFGAADPDIARAHPCFPVPYPHSVPCSDRAFKAFSKKRKVLGSGEVTY